MLPHGLRDLRWLYTTLQMGRGQQQAIVTFQDRLHRPVDGSLLVVALVLAGGMIEGREGAFADRAWPGTGQTGSAAANPQGWCSR
jgi:hypothetical protein